MNRKTNWSDISPEVRAGLIASLAVLMFFPFWIPASFIVNFVISLTAGGIAFLLAWFVVRKRR